MMDNKTAKIVLDRRGFVTSLASCISRLEQIELEGQFTAFELEAIAAWMCDPKGVSEA